MIDLDRWQEVFETLRRNKTRTFLTAAGVFWGVFMLVIMLGFGRGLEKGVTGSMGRWAKNAVAFWPDETAMAYRGHKPDRRIRFNTDDIAAVNQVVDGIQVIAPRIQGGGWGGSTFVTRGAKSEAFSVSGDVPEFRFLEPIDLKFGRFLNQPDLDEYRKVAVIGWTVREAMFEPDEDPIGQSIRIKNTLFTVVGVYRSDATGPQAQYQDGRVFTPITTYGRVHGYGKRIDFFTVLVGKNHSAAAVEADVKQVLKQRHEVDPRDTGGVDSFNREKEFGKLTGLFDGISLLSWMVGVLTLLAGAIGVSNILMISIAERTKEIGLRKAIGATPFSILAQIVQEAMVLTGLSGGLGLVAGVGALALASTIFQMMPKGDSPSMFAPPDLDLGIAVLATVVLTIAGAASGVAPARTALAVKPVEALAHE